MTNLRAGDVMKPLGSFRLIRKDDCLDDVIDSLLECQHDARVCDVFVVEEDDRIIGLLSINDILRTLKHLTKSYRQHEIFQSSSLLSYGSRELVEKTERDLKVGFSLQVKALMQPNDKEKIHSEDPASDVLNVMLKRNLRVMPVYDSDGCTVVGVVRDIDLLACIADVWRKLR